MTNRNKLVIGSIGAFALAGIVYLFAINGNESADGQITSGTQLPANLPLQPERAYEFLTTICDIGPRVSGTEGMARQQQFLKGHFEARGGMVTMQPFKVRHPANGSRVDMANMIVEWHPDRQRRILLCAHDDTRPFPDRDPNPRKRRDIFLGANDGASGVALLCELAYHVKDLPGPFGIDFVLFDGEEFVFDDNRDREWYFMGSTWFARQYVGEPPAHRYEQGVLLDMVGDADLTLYQEINSLRRPAAREIVNEIWDVAARLGVKEFIKRRKHEVRDDHLPLNDQARIPTCNIIDFDYPRPGRQQYWHTTADTPDKCSGESLVKVGWVVLEWLKTKSGEN